MADDKSLPFQVMTQSIIHNAGGEFGGACVIVPPGGGKTIELLMLDSAADEGQFWSTIMTRIQMAIAESDKKLQQSRTFGVR